MRLLPLHVANKIAAGEVVERPAAVLKELVENSLDAGATRIDVVTSQGGRKLVAVRDNGCGMSREDALMSLERQATSKIADVDDIERIDTFGFRGEAIPSIASVSRFTLVTRRADADSGTRLVVNAGTLAEVSECGAPPGTSVEVRDLFCNVPARRKFLRAYATEEGHVRNSFILHALAHPDVGFSLVSDGRELYRLAPGATLEERVRAIFGDDFADGLLPVDATTGDIRVHGYVERPNATFATRREQYIFINGRPSTAPTIAYALKEAYPRRDADSRPAVLLFIDLPPTQVDVNVHPAKREVRFRRPSDVKDAIAAAVSSAMVPQGPATAASGHATAQTQTQTPQTLQTPATPAVPDSAPFQLPLPRNEPPHSEGDLCTPGLDAVAALSDEGATSAVQSEGPWKWFRFLAMTEPGYLILETDAGIVTLNPSAARERIAYELLMDEKHVASQRLLMPEIVKLGPLESAHFARFVDVLQKQGFDLEPFGQDTWKIDAVPQIVGNAEVSRLVASIAYDVREGGAHRTATWREELVAKSVARSFAGASSKLTEDGAVKLVEELCRCRMPYVDPRGRRVMVFTSNRELERQFRI